MSIRPVVLLLVIGIGTAAAAPATGLPELLARVEAIAADEALGDNAEAAQGLHDRAAAALAAERPHAALELLLGPLEWGEAFLYMAARQERVADFPALEELWHEESELPERARARASRCDGAPAQVRAIAERAATQTGRYYSAGRAQGRAANPEAGLFYLGRAVAASELADLCRRLAAPAAAPPQPHDLAGRLVELKQATNEEYERPGAALDQHALFIQLNASLKLLGELIDDGRPMGALYEYLRAVRLLGALQIEDSEDPVGERLHELHRQLKEDPETDHGIALAAIEIALENVEGEEPTPEQLVGARVTVAHVIPAYLEAIRTEND